MPTIEEYQRYVRKANQVEQQYGLPENLLVGLLKTESNFNYKAVSKAGAKGIAQFMPAAAKEFGINPLNPSESIEAAGKYLANNYKKLGNWDDTLRSYNMGLQGVKDWKAGKRKLPKETAEYVGKVYKNANITKQSNPVSDNTIANINDYFNNLNAPAQTSEVVLDSPQEIVEEEEVPEKEDEDIKEVKQKTAEYNFLKDYQNIINTPQQEAVVQEQVQEPIQPIANLQDIFTNVSNFIDNPMQQGGFVRDNIPNLQPQELKSTKLSPRNYLELYLQSPVYLERLKNQGYPNPKNVADSRLNNLRETGVYYQDPNDNFLEESYRKLSGYMDANQMGSIHNPRNKKITINEQKDREHVGKQGFYNRDATEAHELSHAIDAGFPSNTADEAQLFRRLIGSELDEDFRYEDREDMIRKKEYNDLPHDFLPKENKADINALRYILYKNGIYDTTKDGEFKKEHLDKIKNNDFIKKRLKNNYKDEDLIWLMNKIAQNDGQDRNVYGQQGGTIGNLSPAQTADVEKQREWLNNWNANRVIGGQKINSNYQIPFSSDIYIDDLNYGNNNRETTLGEFDNVSDRLILDTNYQSKQGIPAHELTHRYQKYLSPDLYKQYINEPISKALQNTQGSSEYHGNVDENQAELNRLRYIQGFRPDQTITPQNLQNYNPDEYNLKHFSQDQLINLLNTTAYTPNNNDVYYAQTGGEVINDNNGQWNNPGSITRISSPNITMQGVNFPVLGISEQTGEKKLMLPNQNYFFENTESVIEYPQITKAEKAFLKEISSSNE